MRKPSPRRKIRSSAAAALALTIVAGCLATSACSSGSDEKYTTPASQKYSGQRKATMPPVPTLPTTPMQFPDKSYTIYGATHHFRSPRHVKEVTGEPIAITGFIVKTNYDTAPECAQHPQGKGDKDCPQTEVPSFWIADTKGDTKGPMIRVINWAHNFTAVYDAITAYKDLKPGEQPKEKVVDKAMGSELPLPLPMVGAKVKVTGKYGLMGSNGGSDRIADPKNGVFMLEKVETLEAVPEKAAFTQTAVKKKT